MLRGPHDPGLRSFIRVRVLEQSKAELGPQHSPHGFVEDRTGNLPMLHQPGQVVPNRPLTISMSTPAISA